MEIIRGDFEKQEDIFRFDNNSMCHNGIEFQGKIHGRGRCGWRCSTIGRSSY